MKKSKIFLSFILTVSLLAVTMMPCFAEQSDYNYLLSCGFTEDFLNKLPENNYSRIRAMIGDSVVTNTSVRTCSMSESSATARGAIDPDYLELQMVISEICDSGTNNINLYLVAASWEWSKNRPYNKLLEDAITVNWNAELLNLADSGAFYSQDWYRNSQNGEQIVVRENTTLAESAQGGIGFYTKFDYGSNFVGGSMALLLETSVPMTTGNTYSSTINLGYAHNPSGINGIGFSVYFVSVNFDLSAFCDTMATSANIHYS